jgi:hypothetical protein
MNADFRRVKDIFLAALDRDPGALRSAYLDEACGQDSELRQRVEALLARHEAAGSFLESPPPAVDPYPTIDEPKDERPGMVIGPASGMAKAWNGWTRTSPRMKNSAGSEAKRRSCWR